MSIDKGIAFVTAVAVVAATAAAAALFIVIE